MSLMGLEHKWGLTVIFGDGTVLKCRNCDTTWKPNQDRPMGTCIPKRRNRTSRSSEKSVLGSN